MKIKSLKISGVGGIKELNLTFQEGFNVLCGANGIGKTTILNTIADSFINGCSVLKRNSGYTVGTYTLSFQNVNGRHEDKKLEVKEFNPLKNDSGRYSSDNTKYIMLFNINRTIDYKILDSIPKDTDKNIYNVGSSLSAGITIADLKGWFINRYLFADKDGSLTDSQKFNFDRAKDSFALLDSAVNFKTVDAGSLDIMLNTSRGEIYFEYLSAGYKTCIYIVLGIIKEVEIRFRDPYIKVTEFDGVILIDEIDLHLHPTWQAQLINALKKVFPKTQFIVTTHSPSILQSLNVDEIIPLTMDDENNISVKDLNLGSYGLQGWTIEEILKYVMEMPTTASDQYMLVQEMFDKAMDDENIEEIRRNYAILKEMLHPNSTLKKLLEIQVAGMGILE